MSDSSTPYNQALSLASNGEDDFLELGALLLGLLDNDPRSFKQLIDETGLSKRKAYYLVSISRTFGPLSIPRERLQAIGLIKLQALTRYIEASNADALLHMAETNTTADLHRLLKAVPPTSGANRLSLNFSDSDFAIVAEALAKFGGVLSASSILNGEQALVALVKAAQHNAGA